MQIALAGDVLRAITAITDMFGSRGKVLLFLVSPNMLMIMAVCIAAAQCMPCCIRDTKDCLYSGGTMYAVLYSRYERLLRT